MKAKILISLPLLILPYFAQTQNVTYGRNIIDTLCTSHFAGRGYSFSGDSLAADYISKECLKYTKDVSFQEFSLNTNSLVGENLLIFDNDTLRVGEDYICAAFSESVNDTFNIVILNKELYENKEAFQVFHKQKYPKHIIVIDSSGISDKDFKVFYPYITQGNYYEAAGVIELNLKLPPYIPSQEQRDFFLLNMKRELYSDSNKYVKIKIDSEYTQGYKTKNVIAKLGGESDTAIVFTAHYDHIGTMSKSVFVPGANDNASGTAMVMSLLKYFSQQNNHYTMYFILFSGEELGLLGSFHYTEHPIFPLSDIKFLVNLDMVGSGSKGIQVVNGSVHKPEFELLQKINSENKLLTQVKIRGAAANSDHYPFHDKNVKTFFIYTLGNYKEYHNIYDRADALPLTEFEDLRKLLILFVNEI